MKKSVLKMAFHDGHPTGDHERENKLENQYRSNTTNFQTGKKIQQLTTKEMHFMKEN